MGSKRRGEHKSFVKTMTDRQDIIADFSMEIALEEAMPASSGGLGMLAGDTLRSADDLSLPKVAVSFLHRQGCFTQALNAAPFNTQRMVQEHVLEASCE